MGEPDLDHWDPMDPRGVAGLLERCTASWWIAGGYAIDAFVGRFDRRRHDDVDVGLLARDQTRVRECLDGWDLYCVDPPGHLRRWERGEVLREPIHDVWARDRPDGPWRFDLTLNPSRSDVWTYRRDDRIRLPVSELAWYSNGVPYLVPEVQLLFKSKEPRPKDEQDFSDSIPFLSSRQRAWLRDAIGLITPEHPWLARLS